MLDEKQGPAFGMLLETIINKAMKRQTEEGSEDSLSEVSSTSPVTKAVVTSSATGSSKRKRAAPQYKPQQMERVGTPPARGEEQEMERQLAEDDDATKAEKKQRVDNEAALPAPPGPFPCVWLGVSSPSRATDHVDMATPPSSDDSPEGGAGYDDPGPPTAAMHTPPMGVIPTPPASDSEQPPTSSVTPPRDSPIIGAAGVAFPTAQPAAEMGGSSPLINGVATFNYPGSPAGTLPGSPNLPGSPMDATYDPDSGSEVCPECKKVFKRKVYLQRHMEREHWSTAKVFKCDDCSYETKHQSNLSVHRRIHTGERPYHCGACGQRYTQGHLLKSHIRSRHNGDMSLYNLDKKSDSTRGRKSLDSKHEMGVKTADFKTNDKISEILAQNQQKLNDILNPPPLPRGGALPSLSIPSMTSVLNSPFMSSLNSGIRPPMGMPPGLGAMSGLGQAAGMAPHPALGPTPMNPGGLLTTPRFLTMPGMMGSSMFPGFGGLGNMPMTSQVKSEQDAMNSANAQQLDAEAAAAAAAAAATGLKIPLRVPDVTSPEKAIAPSGGGDTPEDLSVKRNEIRLREPPTEAERAAAQALKTLRESLVTEQGYESGMESPLVSDCKTKEEPNGKVSLACNDDCSHARKLHLLRKNVLRMLSVLTPDLNVENGVDSTSDQVDDLLHEVIYSNAQANSMAT